MTLWKQTRIVECAYKDVGLDLNTEEIQEGVEE